MVGKAYSKFLSFIFKCVLYIIGWNINQDLKYSIESASDKAVLIYPHSSYLDYFFFCLYYYAYELDNFYVIVTERFVPFEFMCRYLIPAPDFAVRNYMEKEGYSRLSSIFYAWVDRIKGVEVKSSYTRVNFVKSLCDKMRDKKNYYILISPTGSVSKNVWRSGYYHIAKELKIPIIIAGVDYEKKDTAFEKIVDIDKYTLESQDFLESSFNNIKTALNTKDLYIFNWASIIHFINFLLFYSCANSFMAILWSITYYFGCNNFLRNNKNGIGFCLSKMAYSLYACSHNLVNVYLGIVGLLFYHNSISTMMNAKQKNNNKLCILGEILYGVSCFYIYYYN